jgi:hypothetical protein
MADITNAVELLRTVIPFRYLERTHRESLGSRMHEHIYVPGEIIVKQGDLADTTVYLLASGLVEVFDPRSGADRRVNTIEPGHYFGEWEPLFKVPRVYGIRALHRSRCYSLTGDQFLEVVSRSRPFALGLGAILRDRQGIFAAFERFKVELLRGAAQGYLTVEKLLPLYTELEPAIHPGVASQELDVAALAYAIRRLPANVTRTFAYLLTDTLPPAYRDPDHLFEPVPTDARRRDVWQMVPGESLVLLRFGISDLTDFITCLCVYAVEARKIRRRLDEPQLLESLKSWDAAPEPESEQAFLSTLPLSQSELRGLTRIWPGETAAHLWEIARHRESFAVSVNRHSAKYNSQRSERWTTQVAAACRRLTGTDPVDLDPSLPVHVISSNTHSVTNCLNSWFSGNASAVLEWALETRHPLATRQWRVPMDQIYALSRDYFRAHPEFADAAATTEAQSGIERLRETASTGIQVQLIDLSRIRGCALDPGLQAQDDLRGLVVNIDYAFGEQAEHILRNLLMLFGRQMRSVSLLGKAGALVGRRGDILVPTAFIEQSSDRLMSRSGRRAEREQRELSQVLESVTVHAGPMLTVDGTLLQNATMLRFYSNIWKCIGIEMEGAYYFRQLCEAQETGLASGDVDTNFIYYVSDLPLNSAHQLSARLEPSEGIPPLYGITRFLLNRILTGYS